jgi:hypothetical protein
MPISVVSGFRVIGNCSAMFVPSMPISVVSGFRVIGNTRFCVRCAVPDCVLLVGFALFCSVCSASGWGMASRATRVTRALIVP